MTATALSAVAAEFPTLAREGVVYLDSAATSQTPRAVVEAMDDYYAHHRASVHRGVYPLAAEATEMEKGGGGAALSDRLLDAVCLLGPLARCREQLAVFRKAGVDLPILVPPIGLDGARAVIRAFRR